MASGRLNYIIPATHSGSAPAAFIQNLPLSYEEAVAFSNIEAGFPAAGDRERMASWLVKMALVHGSWVFDELGFVQGGRVSTG